MKLKKSLVFSLVVSIIIALFLIEIYPFLFKDSNFKVLHLPDVAANFFGLFPLNFLFLLISKKHGISQVFFYAVNHCAWFYYLRIHSTLHSPANL
jgi:hypothetical protein